MRNIVAFDVETTGLDASKDSILQIAAVKFNLDFDILDSYCVYVIPTNEFEIAQGAFEKHGLTKEYILDNGFPSNEVMKVFNEFCEGCDMLSYNGNSFDIKFIAKEMKDAGIEFDLNRVFYDSLKYEALLNPRNLEHIYTKYTGKILDNAHNALADVKATIEVFKYQLAEFGDRNYSMDDIMGFDESKIFCIDGMIKKVDGEIKFAKGKYRDVEFMKVAAEDPGYIRWFMNNPDFDINTKIKLKEYYALHRK